MFRVELRFILGFRIWGLGKPRFGISGSDRGVFSLGIWRRVSRILAHFKAFGPKDHTI